MTSFTPVSATIGGLLIGLAVVGLLHLLGRIAGVSGIVYGVLGGSMAERLWRVAFVIGLISGAAVWGFATGDGHPLRDDFSPYLLVLGGFLVGFGTRLGNGCTSGHGVCGVARLSRRSLMATLVFLVTGMVTVFLIRLMTGDLA